MFVQTAFVQTAYIFNALEGEDICINRYGAM